ncbi:MAG: hypothetical protein LBT37_06135 [Lactobacillaceae bacterium]|jgi:hypothetical protein|nr:hypothetical protein [Lactobacillaceae bacterium]
MMIQPIKTKTAVLREEYLAITGNVTVAMLLNQMIYWSERVRDADKFAAEENKRMEDDGNTGNQILNYGWIYKTAADAANDLMNMASEKTFGRAFKTLIELGFLDKRQNPDHAYDHTLQYRVNLVKIQNILAQHGYVLNGYTMIKGEQEETQNDFEIVEENVAEPGVSSNGQNVGTMWTNLPNRMDKMTDRNVKMSDLSGQNVGTIPETTTKTTTEIKKSDEEERERVTAAQNNLSISNPAKTNDDASARIGQVIENNPDIAPVVNMVADLCVDNPQQAAIVLESIDSNYWALRVAADQGNTVLSDEQKLYGGSKAVIKILFDATSRQLTYMKNHLADNRYFGEYFTNGLASRIDTMISASDSDGSEYLRAL